MCTELEISPFYKMFSAHVFQNVWQTTCGCFDDVFRNVDIDRFTCCIYYRSYSYNRKNFIVWRYNTHEGKYIMENDFILLLSTMILNCKSMFKTTGESAVQRKRPFLLSSLSLRDPSPDKLRIWVRIFFKKKSEAHVYNSCLPTIHVYHYLHKQSAL